MFYAAPVYNYTEIIMHIKASSLKTSNTKYAILLRKSFVWYTLVFIESETVLLKIYSYKNISITVNSVSTFHIRLAMLFMQTDRQNCMREFISLLVVF